MGIAVTRDGKLVITGDAAMGELVVVAAERREVKRRIALGHQTHAIDVDPHDRWVVAVGRHPDHDGLSQTTFIDVKALEKVETISTGLGNAAHFAFTPDGKELWAASISTNLAWVIDVRSRRLSAVIPLTAGELMDRPATGVRAGPAARSPPAARGADQGDQREVTPGCPARSTG